jgi:hypothetical protein
MGKHPANFSGILCKAYPAATLPLLAEILTEAAQTNNRIVMICFKAVIVEHIQ